MGNFLPQQKAVLFIGQEMQLETIVLSKGSQSQTNTLSLICGSYVLYKYVQSFMYINMKMHYASQCHVRWAYTVNTALYCLMNLPKNNHLDKEHWTPFSPAVLTFDRRSAPTTKGCQC